MNATATVSEHPAKPASTAIAKTDVTKVRDLLMKNADGLKVALPQHIPVSAFIRVALTVVQRTPALLECDRTSLLGAMFQAAQLGLSLDPSLGQAYLVPFKNTKKNRSEVQFIPGYRGLVDLVRRSGQLSTIDADVVRQKDTFRFVRGFSPLFEHIPEDTDPGPVTKVYAWARLKDGGVQMKVMTVADVEKIRKRSKAATTGPWVTDWDWMAKKTAIKQLCKLLPVSTETERAMHLDDRHESGRPQDLAMLADETETPTVTDEDEVINAETGEVQMPKRVSEQATPPATEPIPKAAAMPAGADRIVDVAKKTGKRGVYWLAECESKRNVFTYDAGLGAALERFKASGELCDLVADPAVANGWREIVSIEPVTA